MALMRKSLEIGQDIPSPELKNVHKPSDIADGVARFCLNEKSKFVFISGNGASGKSSLSQLISHSLEQIQEVFRVNPIISLDDLLVNTAMRKNSEIKWVDNEGITHLGTATSSMPESYFLPAVRELLFNLKQGNSVYFGDKSGQKLINSDKITIFEGVGVTFVDKPTLHVNLKLNSKEEE